MKKILFSLVGIIGIVLFFGSLRQDMAGAVDTTYIFKTNEKDLNLRIIEASKVVSEVRKEEFSLFNLREKIETIKGQIISLQAEQVRLQAIYDEAKAQLSIP